ncbi:MAG: hypothetical protein RBS99_17450 [Rhodospirillales bacterium]|nr:hypothetical protein [Rhodospirillales bacterium]
MPEDVRLDVVKSLLFDYVKSPSLRHIRDPHAVNKLAREITSVFRGPTVWRKWDGQREALLRQAINCWIPIEDLHEYLNGMPGPNLTTTDVAQRLRALWEEDYASYPNDVLQESCLALYEKEMAAGTELPAVIGALQEHVEGEERRLRVEQKTAWRMRVEEERIALQRRFLSGADCKWTSIEKSKELYRRINGRSYRLSPTADKLWKLFRIDSVGDEGVLIGKYSYRRDVNKLLAKLAYEPEPRW